MRNTLLMKLRHLYYKNPQRKQPKIPYDIAKVIEYAKSVNKRLNELTEQELTPFIIKR